MDVWSFDATDGRRMGQSFTMPYTSSVSQIQLYMRRTDNGWTEDYRLMLKTGVPGPGGSTHAIVNFNSSTISTTLSWVTFEFTPVELTEGNTYHWLLRQMNNAGDDIINTPILQLYFQVGGSVYAGGDMYVRTNSGGSWTIRSDWDHRFTVGIGRQIENPTPSDIDTSIGLAPLLQWEIGGVGLQENDSFSVYLKAGDSDFGEDDLLQSGIEDLDLQIISGLSYNTLYYWQVQIDTADDALPDSDVWSFTTLVFAYPVVSVDGSSNPTGINNMVTLKRVVVAANDGVFYET